MTREIALEILKSLDVYKGGDIDQAIQFAIKVLEQEPCEDAISREDVLDEIRADIEQVEIYDGCHIDRDDVLEIIDNYRESEE